MLEIFLNVEIRLMVLLESKNSLNSFLHLLLYLISIQFDYGFS